MRTQDVADYTFLYMREAHLTQSMSENVKNYSCWDYVPGFQTHSHFNAPKCGNVARWDYVYFFPNEKICKKVWRTDIQTHRQTIPFRRCFSHQKRVRTVRRIFDVFLPELRQKRTTSMTPCTNFPNFLQLFSSIIRYLFNKKGFCPMLRILIQWFLIITIEII